MWMSRDSIRNRLGNRSWPIPIVQIRKIISNDFPWKTIPWKSKTKQRMVFRMIHIKDSLLQMGKVWSLDFLGIVQRGLGKALRKMDSVGILGSNL